MRNIKCKVPARQIARQSGYALLAMITLLMIIGAMASGGVSLSTKSEQLAGSAIQRSRSFQAADGASALAEGQIKEMMRSRIHADVTGSKGIYARDHRADQWWRLGFVEGIHEVDPSSFLGVVSPPRYVVEQVGDYVSDGGTGVVSLDVGGASYGRSTAGGREFLVFSVESQGKGSYDTVDTVVETTVAFSY